MELRELNPDERTAVVGLLKIVVMSDLNVSEEEQAHVQGLVRAFGQDGYARALDAFDKRFRDEAAFRKFLSGIGRQEARDLIFATVLEGAGEGAVEGREGEILDWLSRTWNVRIEIADGAGA
jgi:hypothetical protein